MTTSAISQPQLEVKQSLHSLISTIAWYQDQLILQLDGRWHCYFAPKHEFNCLANSSAPYSYYSERIQHLYDQVILDRCPW